MPDLDQLAAAARQRIDTRGGSAAAGFSTEARTAIERLTERLAEQLGQPLADWAVTRWIVTRQPLNECIATERIGHACAAVTPADRPTS